MPKVSLSGLNVERLMELRKQIEVVLHKRRAEIQQQLERIASLGGETVARRRGTSALKGRKIKPKYRGPKGETWAGRGARPRWLVAAVKGGKKLENFLIEKAGRMGRKKRRTKR
jgi:DNA-binding protein H-NS